MIGRFFKTLKAEELPEAEAPAETENSAEVVPDAEASLTTGRAHEEFATRRGGRRRRRPNKKPTDTVEGNGADGSWGEWTELGKNPKAAPLSERHWWQFNRHPRKLKPTEWLLEVMARPEEADTRPAFLIHHSDLLGELKLQEKGIENSGLRYYTFEEVKPAMAEIGKQAKRIIKREKDKPVP